MKSKRSIVLVLSGVVLVALFLFYRMSGVKIESIQLSSPNNYAFQEDIRVVLNKPAKVVVRYWNQADGKKFETLPDGDKKEHTAHLLLLETNAAYQYEVVVRHGLFSYTSKVYEFHTREQSPWLKFNWLREDTPHDPAALDRGMVILCYARKPGYIAMVDGKGDIRWYWQVDDIGVRVANLTPRGTIIAMLRPPVKDVINDVPKNRAQILREMKKPIRRGKIGFVGGTAIVEIDLTGKMLWRMDLDKNPVEGIRFIHHDIRMDEEKNLYTLYRPKKIFDMSLVGGQGTDTLVGDGILVMDTTGHVIWKWSIWDHWNILEDPYISRFAYDRFHANALNFDTDGNFLLSLAIEDQIWKINRKTGEVMWKLGKGGDFSMDSAYYFSFQHDVHIEKNGDLMLFDNDINTSVSRVLSFSLDTVNKVAKNTLDLVLPPSYFSSRMGSAYRLPNRDFLICSAKTGTVLVMNASGKVLWELHSHFVPYRAEYIPRSTWDKYFKEIDNL